MCSYFLERMENYQGDLADIIRASRGSVGGGTTADVSDWQFQSDQLNFHDPSDDFGHPFSDLRDPLLHELHISGSSFYNTSNCSTEMVIKNSVEDTGGFGGGGGGGILDDEMKIRPCSIFSRILQISPNAKLPVSPTDSPMVASSPRGLKAATLVSNDVISANSFKGCLAENTAVQISSPRNMGIKRRKGQAKKVMCIPAPAPANTRPTGEIVPSDLWAWRKYGQKPIKGSPYPRGYYRCSSSKGCSARKQVERSRTDPNMLVITYTSEHNHPWPTQRNALAGSTRTQPSKNNTNSTSNSSSSKNSPKILKEEEKEIINRNTDNVSSSIVTTTGPPVKEEVEDLDKQMDMDDGEFGQGFHQSYRPALPDSNHGGEDFFADLGELEADPLNLLFTQGFSGDDERRSDKSVDPFSFYDWTGSDNNSSSNNNNNSTSFGDQAKSGL